MNGVVYGQHEKMYIYHKQYITKRSACITGLCRVEGGKIELLHSRRRVGKQTSTHNFLCSTFFIIFNIYERWAHAAPVPGYTHNIQMHMKFKLRKPALMRYLWLHVSYLIVQYYGGIDLSCLSLNANICAPLHYSQMQSILKLVHSRQLLFLKNCVYVASYSRKCVTSIWSNCSSKDAKYYFSP